jgi:hypothetical protein
MSIQFDPLPTIMREAVMPGAIANPVAMLTAIASVENPIRALSDDDQANDLFAALDSEFGFIRFAKNGRSALQSEEQSRWTSLVRWLICAVQRWRQVDDPGSHTLVAIFIVAQTVDWNNELWTRMPSQTGSNIDLIQRLKELIGSFSVRFNAPSGAAEPISYREALERFTLADTTGDWAALEKGLMAFRLQPFPNTLQTQAVRCLYSCGIGHLVEALSNLRQTIVALQIASTITVEQRFVLAVTSDNPYVQFGCVYHTLTNWPVPNELSANEQQLLTKVLLKVANDGARWDAWMKAFNASPMRHSALQVALGRALADGPDLAIDAYVNSINLSPKPSNSGQPDYGRLNVAACLRTFRRDATPPRRAMLWTCAHKRWLAWRFDQANQDAHLFAINWSELDYALVGFACECLDDVGRQTAMEGVQNELQLLDERWHASISSIVTEWNRLLSQLQPYAHASHTLINGEDWLLEGKTYLPFDPSTNEYFMMKYRLF